MPTMPRRTTALDSPESVEQYRVRYAADRQGTFDAYVEVFFTRTEARSFSGGWTLFSRCANAEPALVRQRPELVQQAEAIMQGAGYALDDGARSSGGGRRWVRD